MKKVLFLFFFTLGVSFNAYSQQTVETSPVKTNAGKSLEALD
jgi:hypothetical protein